MFVIPADGNRQRLEFHRHRKGFELSLQALVSGLRIDILQPEGLDGDQVQSGGIGCIQWVLMRDYCKNKGRQRERIKVT